jgi:hypothetical protein
MGWWTHLSNEAEHWRMLAFARSATVALLQVGSLVASLDANALTAQTISFAALSGKTFGAMPFAVSATASSGLVVSFSSLTTTTCSVGVATVTILAAGTCTIQAGQAGNASYAAAPSVNQSFTVSKAAQTIAFAALPGKTYGAAPFAISATASSGLPVSFVSATTGVCTVSGATVTIVVGGTCTIQARQGGNGNFNAATSINQSFAIAKAAQSITFAALAGKIYGNPSFAVSATASSGLAVTFTSTTATVCTVTSSTVTIKSGGTCTITAAQAGNNSYNAALNVSQSFAVAKANQTIAFAALATQTYGASPFTVGATASSALAVIFSSLTTTVCTISANTVTIKSAGTCTIQAAQAGNTSYVAAAPVSQSFGVAKAAQTITFGTLANRVYGNAPFTVIATASSGLAVSYASLTATVCTASGSTITIRSAGSCSIQATQGGSTNFNAAISVSQTFTITQGAQTISFPAPANRLLGGPPLVLTATASSGLAVSYSSLTPATCALGGSAVTLLSAGTCTVQAAQAGNGSYSAAASVTQSFVVIAAPQFSGSAAYLAGTYPEGIAVGDFNGDGKLDVAVANAFSGNVSILLGDGAGGLSPGTTVQLGGQPAAVVAGDFNGDGKPDLAVADLYYSRIFLLSGNGNGNFAVGIPLSAGLAPIALASSDLNHDGKLDLVVVNGSSGNTTGQSVTVLLGNGNGSFGVPLSYPTGASPYAVVAADFNGDGNQDLAVASGDGNNVSILLGRGDGTFATAVNYGAGFYPDGIAAGDLNGDGKVDLAIANDYSNDVSILLGRGDGTFGPAARFTAGNGPASVVIADFNGDGRNDLAIANRFDDTVTLLVGNGDGTFQPALAYAVGAHPAALVAVDLNRDGRIDILVTEAADNDIAVLLQSGTVAATMTLQSGSPQSIALNGAYAPLVVLMADGAGRPLSSASVTFVAPPTGASGTFAGGTTNAQVTTDAYGLATAPTFTANATSGSFSVIATASGASVTFSLTNAGGTSQSISFGVLPGKVYGAAPFGISATASSGLAVSFASMTTATCTVGGTIVSLVGVGTCTIRASQPGNAAYAAASNVDQSFAIARATQTISFGAIANQTAGGAPASLSATASSGLAVAFSSLTTAVCSVVGATVTPIAIGTCTVRAAQAGNANYAAAASVDQSFGVTGAPQTITFAALANKLFGSGVFNLSATTTSGLTVSFSSLTPMTCAVGGNTVALVVAGTCTIRAAQAGNASFGPASNVDRTFIIAQGGQTIDFAALADLPLDASPKVLRASASSGLPVSFASRTPTVCSVEADLVSAIVAGTCTIRASQGGNANYLPAPIIDRSFAITRVTQSIAFANPGTHAVSTTPFALSATASSGLPITFASLTVANCSVNGGTATAIAIGTCTIRASQAGNANYPPAWADQGFLIVSGLLFSPPAPPAGPMLTYATYLGGYGADKAFDVIVAPDGAAYVGGSVASSNFPGLSSSAFTNAGLDLLFITRVNPSGGKLDFSTVTGGRAVDISGTGGWTYVGVTQPGLAAFIGGGQVEAIATDGKGNVYAASYANSTDYPVRGGTYMRGGPKYIFKVGATGAVQVASSAIDPAVKTIRALAIDAAGAIYLTGVAGPGLATTAGALLAAMPTPTSVYVTASAPYLIKLMPGGAATAFATYLSVPGRRPWTPDGYDQSLVDAATTAYALAVDASGNSYVAGQATSDEFPVTPGSPDTADTKHRDAFVAKVNPTGTALLFTARLGGADAERATGIALSPDGAIVIGGKTATQPFWGAAKTFQQIVVFRPGTPYLERETGFVAKLAADGKQWLFIATLGADGGNLVNGAVNSADISPVKVAVDASGAIYAVGTTSPYRDLVQHIDGSAVPNALGGIDTSGAFVVKISSDGAQLLYLAALGGLGTATGLALDNTGNAYVSGYGLLTATVDASLAAPMYEDDYSSAFVAKLNDQYAPLILSTDRNPAVAGQTLILAATVADARDSGTVEFDDGSEVLGIVPVSNGRATLPVSLGVGVHRLGAIYRGGGPFDGHSAPEVVQSIDQAPAP